MNLLYSASAIRIFQINSGIVNLFALVTPANITLIDCGLASSWIAINSMLHRLHLNPSMITDVLITHADPDHYGGIPTLLKYTSPKIAASEVESAAISYGGMSRPLHPQGIERIFYSALAPIMRSWPVKVDTFVMPGTSLQIMEGLLVVDTKGHTPGHISYFAINHGVLFSGDSIQIKRGHLFPSSGANTWDAHLANQSFELQMSLQPKLILGGHGIYKSIS